jgi:peroxiredoxin
MKNIIAFFLLFAATQFSLAQKKIYLDSLNRQISEAEFRKMSEPIEDYVINETNVVNGETVISSRIPDHKTLLMIYAEVAKANDNVKAKVGTPFPKTNLNSTDGESFNIESLAGKIVVMNFWFVECAPCIKEMPELNKLVAEFSANKNVVFLAPSLSAKQKIIDFLKKREFNYRTTYGAHPLLQNELALVSYPTHFIVNTKGLISYITTESTDHTISDLRLKINELLKNSN